MFFCGVCNTITLLIFHDNEDIMRYFHLFIVIAGVSSLLFLSGCIQDRALLDEDISSGENTEDFIAYSCGSTYQYPKTQIVTEPRGESSLLVQAFETLYEYSKITEGYYTINGSSINLYYHVVDINKTPGETRCYRQMDYIIRNTTDQVYQIDIPRLEN
jgi:hypothetical protein